jgi:hypothetical protein
MSEPWRKHARDQAETPFTPILSALVARVPSAHGAALVDNEGECVDYAGKVDPFDIKVSAAQWRVVLAELEASVPSFRSLTVRAERRSFVAWSLPDGYALVVALGRGAGFASSSRAYAACARALCVEAGWAIGADIAHWHLVDVTVDRRMRPRTVAFLGESPAAVDVLGAVMGMTPSEKGFRVRLHDSGVELTVVREPGGAWYADDTRHDSLLPPQPRTSQKQGSSEQSAASRKYR